MNSNILATIDLIFMLSLIAMIAAIVPCYLVEQAKELPELLRKARIAWDNRSSMKARVQKSRVV